MASEHANASTELDFTALTKTFAICLVVLTHAGWTEADRLCPIFPFVVNAAVPLFMMVTGLNYARSYRRRGMATLPEMYGLSMIRRRICALLLPFIPVFLLEIPLAALRNNLGCTPVDLSPAGLLMGFVSGGWGPGGYYLPVMIQVVLIYPLLYCLIRRFRWLAFAGVSASCFVLDCASTALGFPVGAWRLLCVRYLPHLAFGALLALDAAGTDGAPKAVGRGICAALLVVGGGYLACLTYGSLADTLSALQQPGWSTTSLPSALFFMGVFGLLWVESGGSSSPDVVPVSASVTKAVGAVAQNTWFIFLFQSVWYFAGANSVFDFLPALAQAALFLCVCVPVGCAFGWLWRRLASGAGRVGASRLGRG